MKYREFQKNRNVVPLPTSQPALSLIILLSVYDPLILKSLSHPWFFPPLNSIFLSLSSIKSTFKIVFQISIFFLSIIAIAQAIITPWNYFNIPYWFPCLYSYNHKTDSPPRRQYDFLKKYICDYIMDLKKVFLLFSLYLVWNLNCSVWSRNRPWCL